MSGGAQQKAGIDSGAAAPSSPAGTAALAAGSQNLFKVFLELHKYPAGMGCKARCSVDSLAIHKRRNAADRPARHLPAGLE